jgi:hypothetical protein
MNLKLANNATSKLTGGVSPTGTDFLIDPADDGKFPVIASVGSDYFRITLEDSNNNIEVVKCNQHVSGSNTLKCTSVGNRAQEGTSARTWVTGDVVEVRVTKADLDDISAIGDAAQATADAHIADTTDAHDETAINDISQDVAAMQAVVDPGEVGTESLPTDLAGEIKRLRNMIKEITGKAKWYESPASMAAFLAAANTFTGTQAISLSVNNYFTIDAPNAAAKSLRWSDSGSGKWDMVKNGSSADLAIEEVGVAQRVLVKSGGGVQFNAGGVAFDSSSKMTAGIVPLARMQRTEQTDSGGASVNSGTLTNLKTVNLGTVNTGDRILVSAAVDSSALNPNWDAEASVVASAGTAAIFGIDQTSPNRLAASLGSVGGSFGHEINLSGILKVATGGTLTLAVAVTHNAGVAKTYSGGIIALVLNNG